MRNRIFLGLSLALCVGGCTPLELPVTDSDMLVVESYLVAGKAASINLSYQQASDSSADRPDLSLLEVFVSDGESTEQLVHQDSGLFVGETLIMEAEKTYFLEFTYRDEVLSASTEIPTAPEDFAASSRLIEGGFPVFEPGSGPPAIPEPITLSWSNPNGEYHIIVVENVEENPELIETDTERPQRVFRSVPTQSNEELLAPPSFTYYGRHRVILFRINAEYASLYEQLETTSLDITEPPTNVVNGLGIFTGINADTLTIEVI